MKVANRPKFKKYIFAQEATNDTIEPVPDTETATQEAQGYIGYQKGFTINNMKPLTEGGKPPRGQQLNQLLNDITSVTQYATMGGTYDLNTNISADTGYPKNSLITNDSGIYRSLQDDNKITDLNNTNYWQKIIDINPPQKKERQIGSYFYACRNETILNGALKCDGSEYNLADYPDLEKYFFNHQINYFSFKNWDNYRTEHQDNVGYFGYDKQSGKFRVPKIQSGTYLSPTNMPNGKIARMGRGTYENDRIVNLTGKILGLRTAVNQTTGANAIIININGTWRLQLFYEGPPNYSNHHGLSNLEFNASKSPGVNVGDRVMPRTIFENLYVTVSEHY